MTEFLLSAGGFILFTVAAGLVRILSGPGTADRVMAAQLLGTGGIASLLLVASATAVRGVEDVALGLALLAAFVSVAFVNGAALGLALLAAFVSVAFVNGAAPPEADDPRGASGG